jgi:hypothetical protein
MKKEMDERSHTISQKETRILEIKQKNQELEKYRFVLDYKINELKNELSKFFCISNLTINRSKGFDDYRYARTNQRDGRGIAKYSKNE